MKNKSTILFAAFIVCMGGSQTMASTVAYWQFDATSGQAVLDSSGGGYHLVLGNAGGTDTLADPTRTANGYSNGALDFSSNSHGDIVKFENGSDQSAALEPSGSWTVEAFFNLSKIPSGWGSSATPNTLLQWRDTGGHTSVLRLRGNGGFGQMDATYWDGSAYQTLLHTASLETDTWYYVAETYDAGTGTRTLRINSASESDTPGAVNLGTMERFTIGSGHWVSGGNSDGGNGFFRSFDGRIDEVRISDTVVAENDLLINTIPEPATIGLVAFSCFGALLIRRNFIL